MKIFIDDERFPAREEQGSWIIVRDPDSAINLIKANAAWITDISFDNDLGYKLEGRHVMQAILGDAMNAPTPLPRLESIRVHSANVVAAKAMLEAAKDARNKGILRENVEIVYVPATHETYETLLSWYDEVYETEKDRLASI